ncbi:oligoribonuclease [Vibrio cholerae]|nr:oligoribonuclease [Vibrio cholerae]
MTENQLIWTDLETGGLNGRRSNGTLGMETLPIFEIAIIPTDAELNELAPPLRLVIHHSEKVIAQCEEKALEMHTQSGLLEEVRASRITLAEAEQRIIAYFEAHGISPYHRESKTGPIMAGNSIMFDRSFILCQMPKLHDYLHYRQLDISAYNLGCRLHAPYLAEKAAGAKQYKHEAIADIRESIVEWQLYRKALFTNPMFKKLWLLDEQDNFPPIEGELSCEEARKKFSAIRFHHDAVRAYSNMRFHRLMGRPYFPAFILDWSPKGIDGNFKIKADYQGYELTLSEEDDQRTLTISNSAGYSHCTAYPKNKPLIEIERDAIAYILNLTNEGNPQGVQE